MSNVGGIGGMNDSSLEYCFTNIFALTDFSGIQYRRFVLHVEKEYSNALDDPIIRSYIQCLKHNVLCAWVRSKRDTIEKLDPCSFSKFKKELWVFWYGNGDFPNMNACILPDLREEERGNWRQGLSYETRTILFRSLHNVVERCLSTKGFIRLGKWFIQPYKYNCKRNYDQYSIGFSFFLHGESTVCASLDLRQHPLVRRIELKHVQYCSCNQKSIPVILAPYGISAELAGFASYQSDEELNKDIETWSSLYPLRPVVDQDGSGEFGLPQFSTPVSPQGIRGQPQHKYSSSNTSDKRPTLGASGGGETTDDSDTTPIFVNVIVGSFRMRYPCCYVLLTDEVENITNTESSNYSDLLPLHDAGSKSKCPSNRELRNSADHRGTKSLWHRVGRKNNSSIYPRIQHLPYSIPSDLLFNVRRRHNGDRTLRRSSQPRLSGALGSDFSWRDTYRRHPVDTTGTSDNPEQQLTSNGCKCPRTATCQSTVPISNLFHQTDLEARHFLTTMLKDLYSLYMKPKQDSISSCPVTHDPSMPTLSPQQPASLPACPINPTTTSWSYHAKSASETPSKPLDVSSTSYGLCVQTAPPSLSSVTIMSNLEPMKIDSPFTSMPSKLPDGLVSVDHSVSPVKYTLPWTSANTPSLVQFPTKSHWLMEQVAQEYHQFGFRLKRPDLQLTPADEMDSEQDLSGHFSEVYRHVKILTDGLDNVQCDGYSSHLNAKRPRLTGDDPTYNIYADPYPKTSSDPFARYSESTLLTPDIVECDAQSPSAAFPNAASLYARSLGLMPHGVSLASSTGCGHIGPAELALMLPTPPSHDAPQPSPVDGFSAPTGRGPNSPAVATLNSAYTMLEANVCNNHPSDPSLPGSSLVPAQPLSPPQSKLVNLAKQPCIYPAMDLFHDWTFVRPCTVQFEMTSTYLTNRPSVLTSNGLSGPNLAFDHRIFDTAKLSSLSIPASRTISTHHRPAPSPTHFSQSKSKPSSPESAPTSQRDLPIVNSKHVSPHAPNDAPSVPACNSFSLTTVSPGKVPSTNLAFLSDPLSDRLIGMRETSGILTNLWLSDSMLNLFKDHNFDSCNICECTSSVLGAEIDLYISNCVPNSSKTNNHSNNCNNKTQRSSLSSVSSNNGGFGPHDLGGSGFGSVTDCKCGFSAVLNQKYVVNANLFYEDETEVTNICLQVNCNNKNYSLRPQYEKSAGWWIGSIQPTQNHLSLLQHTVHSVYDEFAVRHLSVCLQQHELLSSLKTFKENVLEYDDACTLVKAALLESSKSPDVKPLIKTPEDQVIVHPSYLFKAHSKIPENHNDQIRLLATMRPWLQEAISSTRLLESNYTVDGPLTWKAFHQLAGRGADETCKPQPIPQLRVGGTDKEHLLVSPFALRDWDRLSLCPLSLPKYIHYAIAIPEEVCDTKTVPMFVKLLRTPEGGSEHDAATNPMTTRIVARFFKELSLQYENCRLGKHVPYYRPELNRPETAFIRIRSNSSDQVPKLWRIPSATYQNLMEEMEQHYDQPEAILNRLQSYLSCVYLYVIGAFREHGITVLSGTRVKSPTVLSDVFPQFSRSQWNTNKESDNRKKSKTVGHSTTNPCNGQGSMSSSLDTSSWGSSDDAYLVLYLLNPFTQICSMSPALSRLVTQALIGCSQKIISDLPDTWQSRINVQFLSTDHILSDYSYRLKSLAFAVYSSVNRCIEPSLINANRTLTGMGPAAEKESISNEKEHFHKRSINAPPYTLMGSQNLFGQWDIPPSDPLHRSSVLFVAYCLSQDQHWLLASFTDEQGSLSDQAMINLRVPVDYFNELESAGYPSADQKQRFISPRRIGLTRLWDYVINLLSKTTNPWRLVIGRVGRLGHGELMGWNGLLGRRSLQDVNRLFRDRCSTCAASATVSQTAGGTKATLNLVNSSNGANTCTHELPSLVSACLVSLEPQNTFRVYPGITMSSDDVRIPGGAGSGGNAGGSSGGGGTNQLTGIPGANGSNSASTFALRSMMVSGTPIPHDIPSTTHILVFPTSTSASGLSEHDATALGDMMGIGLFEFLRQNEFEAFDHPAGLEFGLVALGTAGDVGDHCDGGREAGESDPNDHLLGHSSYVLSDQNQSANATGLHDVEVGAEHAGLNSSHPTGRSDDSTSTASALLNTMPHPLGDQPAEVTNLMQQPLAMGYYISTAPTGPLPSWFWASCPYASFQLPVCLKFALHLQTSLVGMDDAAAAAAASGSVTTPTGYGVNQQPSADRPSHLLDSTSTCDVLRYVLEAYNALSWLTINPSTNDRRSCLPVHMLILCQLYQAVTTFI